MSRISFETICMTLAHNLAARSTCARLHVGTVITTTDYRQVLAWGYNGNATGLPNRCDSSEPGACGCLHSEENAIINCSAPRSIEKVVFITNAPCLMCAKRLLNLGGVVRVWYHQKYRSDAGLVLLQNAGVSVNEFAWATQLEDI